MNNLLVSIGAAFAVLIAGSALADITFYEGGGFHGRVFATDRSIDNFAHYGFNDRASSVIVSGGRWEACEEAGYRGRCVVLRNGSYDSLLGMGLNDRISSVRPVDERARYPNESPEPLAEPNYAYRQRPDERVFAAPVTSVHAVVGRAEERCWVERDRGSASRHDDPNVGGAIVGALLGGVLGHQIGGGRGRDVATIGGAVVGGAVGSQVGRDRDDRYDRDVRRCERVADAVPEYWDVRYEFQGVEHRVQLSAPPGDTVAVNRDGEPRM